MIQVSKDSTLVPLTSRQSIYTVKMKIINLGVWQHTKQSDKPRLSILQLMEVCPVDTDKKIHFLNQDFFPTSTTKIYTFLFFLC